MIKNVFVYFGNARRANGAAFRNARKIPSPMKIPLSLSFALMFIVQFVSLLVIFVMILKTIQLFLELYW